MAIWLENIIFAPSKIINMKFKYIFPLAALVALASCGGGNKSQGLADGATGDMETYESTSVNPIVQAKPEIMVIPSDQTLKQFGCIRQRKIDGRKYSERDYRKYLLNDENFKPVVADIQNRFIAADYPLNDFEQTLKSIDNQTASDIASGLAKDSRTRLITAAAPDIVLELNYSIGSDYTKSDRQEKEASYILSAIDAYTNKVVATVQADGLKGENGVELLSHSLNKSMPTLMADIQKYFDDILTRGREITVRINLDADSNQKLTDESIEGDTYADEIMDYVKTNTVKGAYRLQGNTSDQLSFTNVKIKVLNDDGTQFGVYDWTRDLQKYLKKNLGLTTENRSQGLGDVVLTIKGI